MFLNGLTNDEKSAFYSLANTILNADNKVEEKEELLMSQYLQEMLLTLEEMKSFSLDESINIFLKSTMKTRKQIYIELFSLAMCDAEYAIEEKEILTKIARRFNITALSQEKLNACVLELLQVYSKMNDLLSE